MRRVVRKRVVLAAVAAGAVCAVDAVAEPVLAQLWGSLSPEQQTEARESYQRYQELPDRDRERVEERYRRWQNLPPDQREAVRRNYQRYRDLDLGTQQRFNEGYRHWKAREGPGQGEAAAAAAGD